MTYSGGYIMKSEDMISIFDQINNLNIPSADAEDATQKSPTIDTEKESLKKILFSISEEIQRALELSDLTQKDLCQITGMSQSNISKIQNGKITPRIETLQKIASATHTRLVISFEITEEESI